MKIELITDHLDYRGKVYGRGAVLPIDDKEGARLIGLGVAKDADGPAPRVVLDGAGEFFRLGALALGSHHKRRSEMAAAVGVPADADADAQKAALMSLPDAAKLARVVERMQAVEQGWA